MDPLTVEELIAKLQEMPPKEQVIMHLNKKMFAPVTAIHGPNKKCPWVTIEWEESNDGRGL